MLTFVLLLPIIFTIPAVFAWKLFEKAGVPGWKTIIPYYNLYVWMRLIEKPFWWYIILIIPFINIFVFMLMIIELIKGYQRFSLLDQVLAVIVPFIFLPYVASKSGDYIAPKNREKIKKGPVREWVDAILFAVIAATIIRTFLAEAYTIPTSSMERSLLVGDYLFVSKLAYGPKVPNTPLSFPFVHHTLPFTKETNSYLTWLELPDYRFPGFGHVKKGDAVVFNYPAGDTVSTRFQSNRSYYDLVEQAGGRDQVWNNPQIFGKIVARPVDKRENYIKRCIATPGDTIKIINKEVYINGKKTIAPKLSQFRYLIRTKGNSTISDDFFDRIGVSVAEVSKNIDGRGSILAFMTKEAVEKVKQLPSVTAVEVQEEKPGVRNPHIFPQSPDYDWNFDNFGSLWIPKKGATVELNTKNIALYKRVIHAYEGNDLLVKDGKIYINGKEATSYTFKMNYYWMMGDNRDNSADSRVWGFVPENHIVGKAFFVWLSLDQNKPLFDGKIRWNKLFRVVK